MREYGFLLTLIFPYKERIIDSVLVRENTGQWRPVFLHNLWSEFFNITAIFKSGRVWTCGARCFLWALLM